MRKSINLSWTSAVLACSLCLAAALSAIGQSEAAGAAKQKTPHPEPAVTGERIFADNCARCHTPPMVLSQRVTGTVIQHMRMRARLTKKDQDLLLKYLAP